MKFRNKVLSVLLAAGMVASMPAATAVNVLADVDVASTSEQMVGATTTYTVTDEKWDWKGISGNKLTDASQLNNSTFTCTIKDQDGKPVRPNINVKILVTNVKNATCTTDGSETITATAHDSETGLDWESSKENVIIPATGHDYTYTWTFKKTGSKNADGSDEYTATLHAKCRKGDSDETVDATVNDTMESFANCTKGVDVAYKPVATIGSATYYLDKDITLAGLTHNSDGTYSYTAASANTEDFNHVLEISKTPLGHNWSVDSIDWRSSVVTDGKDSYDNDYTYTNTNGKVTKGISVKSDDFKETDAKSNPASYFNHYLSDANAKVNDKITGVSVKLTCSNDFHKASDGPKTVEALATVTPEYHEATCDKDAYVEYKITGIQATYTYKDGSGEKEGKIDINGDALKALNLETKKDVWENTAKGHDYKIKSWTWSSDFSYVTLNLKCKTCGKLISAQSDKVVRNSDGTATVTYAAPDERVKDDVEWYGAEGYYADQKNNAYGKEFTVSALPLKNSVNVAMYRLFNTESGEHLYTSDSHEIAVLVATGKWNNEGIGWYAPVFSENPVYRVYNSKTGEHVFTKDANEKKTLVAAGWNDEGVAFYSDDSEGVAVYRQFNTKAASSVASHNFTTDANEKTVLTTKYGWNDEGIAWYGVAE